MPVKTYGRGPGKVRLVLPVPIRNARPEPKGPREWWYCPACFTPFDRTFKTGCYCAPGDTELDETSYVATPLRKLTGLDEDAAEAAFLCGGYPAVRAIVEDICARPNVVDE